jgi:hypothetical protein
MNPNLKYLRLKLILTNLFLTKREDFVRITTLPEEFRPAFHFLKRDKFLILMFKLRLLEKK